VEKLENAAKILIADDDVDVLDAYAGILSNAGHQVDTATDTDQAVDKARSEAYDLILTDLVFPPADGISVLQEVKRIRPSTMVVLFSGMPNVDTVLSAFRKGAFDFLVKPVGSSDLRELAERVVSLQRQGAERRELAEELENERLKVMALRRQLGMTDPFQKILGSSATMQRLVETLREVARTESTVLLTGESGTGKGIAARAIHEASVRANGPFVEANCVVYSEGILHSELFGHERGAFTGAEKLKKGRFELAEGGTIFLDEIGELSPGTQLLLLRVLQERTFERVGGEQTLEADVRLIAATNRDLGSALKKGEFRSDLYYRLNVVPVHLPPLREHPEDVPVLAQHFVQQCAERMGRDVEGFTGDALDSLAAHAWPGNVRELENLVERMVVLCRKGRIGWDDLPADLRQGKSVPTQVEEGTLQDLERHRIAEALRQAGGNKKLAAKHLGIHRSTLYAKMRRYGLEGNGNGNGSHDPSRDNEETSEVPATTS
jgi:two-component system response regulator HydG